MPCWGVLKRKSAFLHTYTHTYTVAPLAVTILFQRRRHCCSSPPSRTPQPATFEFYDPQSPIYTSPRVLPPATVRNCKVTDAIIAQGSFVSDCTINNAVIGIRSIIGQNCTIQVGVLLCFEGGGRIN